MTPERLIIESMFQIVDKNGADVPFSLNFYQRQLDDTLCGRDIIPKSRQLGMSAYVLARYTAKCLSKRNTRAVVISHDKESTQRMLARVHYYLNNLRGPRAVIKNSSKNELTFPKTNSMFYLGTAGSRKFGRGDTITDLHCSEIAYWNDPKSLVAGLFQAVPRETGEIIIESTGNGTGNYYHRACMRAYEGAGRFRLHFFDWLQAEEYRIPLSPQEKVKMMNSLKPEWDEVELLKRGLTLEQIAFRREKLEEFDYDLQRFKAEYPLTLDECFQASGASIFSIVNYEPTNAWVRYDAYSLLTDLGKLTPLADQTLQTGEVPKVGFWALRDVYKHHPSRYSIGADIGGGVRKDRSAAYVEDVFTGEQVAEYVADNLGPDVFARRLIELGHHFNDAFITVETNNHGAVTLLKLIEGFPKDDIKGYPQFLLYMSNKTGDSLLNYGYKTTARTKPILIGNLRKDFTEGSVKIHSPLLKDELSTYVENEDGKLGSAEGCFDDRVIAAALAGEGAKVCPYVYERQAMERTKREYVNPLTVGLLIDELRAKHAESKGEFAIPPQDDPDGNFTHHIH